jgi:DsbC/DsbD-like thiol-disulfide interchange protein
VARYAALVPVRDGKDINVVKAYMRSAHKRPELVLTLKGKGLDNMTEIFVEGPALASFCHPRFISAKNGQASYFLPVDGITGPQDLKGETLKLTIISDKSRVERSVKLP